MERGGKGLSIVFQHYFGKKCQQKGGFSPWWAAEWLCQQQPSSCRGMPESPWLGEEELQELWAGQGLPRGSRRAGGTGSPALLPLGPQPWHCHCSLGWELLQEARQESWPWQECRSCVPVQVMDSGSSWAALSALACLSLCRSLCLALWVRAAGLELCRARAAEPLGWHLKQNSKGIRVTGCSRYCSSFQ